MNQEGTWHNARAGEDVFGSGGCLAPAPSVNIYKYNPLDQGSADIFCQGPESKFRLNSPGQLM